MSSSAEASVAVARRFVAFRGLPEHPLFPQIHGRIVYGQSAYKVARWIQLMVGPDDPLGPDNLRLESLERRLRRYRALLPAHAMLKQSYLDGLTKGIEFQVDVVNELSALVYYQKLRLSQIAAKEKDFPLGIPLEQQGKEVARLADLLVKLRDSQIILGIVPGRSPGMVKLDHTSIQVDQQLGGGGDLFPSDPLSAFLARHPDAIPDVMEALDTVGRPLLDGTDGARPSRDMDDTQATASRSPSLLVEDDVNDVDEHPLLGNP